MPKYHVYGIVTATKSLGVFEANSEEEAEEMAWRESFVSVCHYCSKEVEGAEIIELVVEEFKE